MALKNLMGMRFGELKVMYRADNADPPKGQRRVKWHCKCSCGKEVDVLAFALTSGKTVSCGHLGKQKLAIIREKNKKETPGTNLSLLSDKPRATNKLHERNISKVSNNQKNPYRISVGYKGTRREAYTDTPEKAVIIRERLRHQLWPGYGGTKKNSLSLEDLTGKRFGKLTVLYRAADYISPKGIHQPKWHCRCSCGNELDVFARRLKNGEKTSCGHDIVTTNKRAFKDLTGKTFGKLTVLYKVKSHRYNNGTQHSVWHCRCTCGNEIDVEGTLLRLGKKNSCGHETLPRDLTGVKFGELTVTGRVADHVTKGGSHLPKWHCKCSCGNELDITAAYLRSGHKQNCGDKSKHKK